eukprot:TRINITY_DN38914_c0_g1_i1.p1 TRINITY_DN38914_c0_g1~~TRINITY_DN38914_c0_g1_i1.p1  ORF type:complete len:145 (+),score=18.15 TRINITY_DN38914_c0_g1_i1:167-601(+)
MTEAPSFPAVAKRVASYEEGPPCLSQAVGGFARSGIAGVAWGLFMGSHHASKKGYNDAASRASYVARSMARNGLLWGGMAAVFYGVRCGFERTRRRRDWVNSGAAGAIMGACGCAGMGQFRFVPHAAALMGVVGIFAELVPSEK